MLESLQALTAAGVLPLKPGANASLAMTRATDAITACSAAFLVPALAAGVDISGLADLPKQCNITGDDGSLMHACRLTVSEHFNYSSG